MKRIRGRRCPASRQFARFRDQDASDPAFKRIVQRASTVADREHAKVIAWGRYANRVWPLKTS